MKLFQTVKDLKRIAIIGLAKNTGKTVTLQKLIDELSTEKVKIGVTSIGHDGEKFDQINNLIKKPQVTLQTGTIVATTESLINSSGAKIEILERTKYETPLGRVSIGMVNKTGNVEIAGPSSVKGIEDVSSRIMKYDAQKVLIDGAINRKAISKPRTIDGLIVSTGAVLNKQISKAIQETKRKIGHILIPQLEIEHREINSNDNLLFDKSKIFIKGFNGTLLSISKNIKNDLINQRVRFIYTNKSITESFLDFLISITTENNHKICLAAKDHTNVFLEDKTLEYYEKRGLSLRVRKTVNLVGISVNPIAPLSHSFDSDNFVNEIQKEFKSIPVFDVLSSRY